MTERVTNLLQRIPGYNGYQDKESRRDEDKRLRTATADQMTQIVDRLTTFNAENVAKRDFSTVSAVENVVSKTRLLSDRIRTAAYGYAGLFSDRPIDGPALDQLRKFDQSIQKRVSKLASNSGSSISSTSALTSISSEIDAISTLFDARGTVIESAQPTREKAVLDLLDTTEPPTPSPLLQVAMGDAFSVLGDDFQATATVTLKDGELSINLIRVGDTNGENSIWFVGASSPEVPSARLKETGSGSASFEQSMRSAIATVVSSRGNQDRVSADYSVASSGSSDTVVFLLTIGGNQRSFSGTLVHDLDVEIYGSGTK